MLLRSLAVKATDGSYYSRRTHSGWIKAGGLCRNGFLDRLLEPLQEVAGAAIFV